MILPYVLRLVCLCLASFFLVHLAVGLVVSLISPTAMRAAERISPRSATNLLLALRLASSVLALVFVAGLCVPSYLWLEPEAGIERVSLGLVLTAIFGVTVWALSIVRGLRGIARSRSQNQLWRRIAQSTQVPGETQPVWVAPRSTPVFALAGIFRSQLVISQAILEVLSTEQLAAALRHERAHRISRDNLKRLILLLAPEIPFLRGLRELEVGWARFTEWAADDNAVSEDSNRSVILAAALVRVARIRGLAQSHSLATSFLSDGGDLEVRVQRLLRDFPANRRVGRTIPPSVSVAALVFTGFLLAAMVQPGTLACAHRLLERLIN